MDVMEVANKLLGHVRGNTTKQGLDELYAPDAVSVEAMDQGQGRETKGVEGIKGKHDWWDANFEVHDAQVEGPYPSGDDRFAVVYKLDATYKETGKREKMDEVAIYHVADGKIVKEEFFYGGS